MNEDYKRGYADAMNWKVQNHLEHLPQRKPLTDEEIEAMWPLRPTDSVIKFARAIEAKLKEKNT